MIVIGVHTPEFDYEKDKEGVKVFCIDNEIKYPIVMDNDYEMWNRYHNRFWPTIYLIDKKGIVRYIQIGEGNYNRTEDTILKLLNE